MKILMVLFFLFLFSETSFAKTVDLIGMATEEGTIVGYPLEVLGMFKQETNNGLWLKDNGNSYGKMQITIKTARFVMKDLLKIKTKMTDSQIKRELITNDRLNFKIAATYYKYLVGCLKDRDLAILAYNVGIGNVMKHGTKFDPYHYLRNVKKHMRDIKKLSLVDKKVEIAEKYKCDLTFSNTYGFWVLVNKQEGFKKLLPQISKMTDVDFEKYLIKEFKIKVDNDQKNV